MRYIIATVLVSDARRRVIACAIAIGGVAGVAAPLRAATVPYGAVMRVDRTIDVAAFARVVASRYEIVLLRAVAADIDRDGDLDVLSSTDRGVLVWVNDGAGRFTSQTPKHRPIIDDRAPGDTWNDSQPRDEETTQNDAPSPRAPVEHAHAPPPAAARTSTAADAPLGADVARGRRTPRAPPAID